MSTPAVREDFALLNGALSTTGLRLTDPNLPYEEFETICFVLGKMHEAVRFAIGDAIIFGEQVYKEKAYQALESLNISEDGMREYVRVAERVPRSIRKKDLSWSHHRAVASLTRVNSKGETVPDYKRQREWLKKAADEQLSHHALRSALRESGVSSTPAGSTSPALPECSCCGRPL